MTARPRYQRSAEKPGSRARYLLHYRPSDYLLELSIAAARLPVVGKHLEPLGATTAMGVWGARHLPRYAAGKARSMMQPARKRRGDRDRATSVAAAALRGIVSGEVSGGVSSGTSGAGRAGQAEIRWPEPDPAPPLWKAFEHRRHLHRSSVRYGSDPAQVLDVWRRDDLPVEPAPVLVFVPGGAWVRGSRSMQGYALMSQLAEQGWVCLAIDYRVAPHHPWPAHIIDVKTAIAWAHANVDKFGGDRDFVAVAGCSAGGHLAALAGLTGHRGDGWEGAEFGAELPPDADTSVDAVVSIYGRYDWQDRSTAERAEFMQFLQRVVVRRSARRHPEVYRAASPIARVHADAPPFLVIHGSADTVIPVAQARDFAERLRSVSHSPVGYLELPGVGHGFDLTDGVRTSVMATAAGAFLDEVHNRRVLAAEHAI